MRLEPYVKPEKRVFMKDIARDTIREFIDTKESAMTVLPDEGMTATQCYQALRSVKGEFDGIGVTICKGVVSLHRRNQ